MRGLRQAPKGWLLLVLLLPGLLGVPRTAIAVEIGEKAPDFALPSTTGGQISLSQFLGKKRVLLEFYVGESPTWGKNLSARRSTTQHSET
jgi:hypothetical protein